MFIYVFRNYISSRNEEFLLCPLGYNGNFKCLFIIVLNINVGAATTGTDDGLNRTSLFS